MQTPQEKPEAEFPELDANAPVLARKLSKLPPAQLAMIIPPETKEPDA